ncbi:hypothetical protein CsSME_00020313 [Camellia sinensis var. sinensis]
MEAMMLKRIFFQVQRESMASRGVFDVIGTQEVDTPVELVVECPQQRLESLDCAIVVCAIMRQYVHHVDVARSLQGGNCSVLRDNMVKQLIGDLLRGVASNMGQTLI